MRKILKKEQKEKLIQDYKNWFNVKFEDEETIIFEDLILNQIIYKKNARTRLFYFKLVDETLMRIKHKSFTFVSAPKKFKEYNIVKRRIEEINNKKED